MWHTLVLGVIQGLTEFLPVSSSAHLIFASNLFSVPIPLEKIVLLHVGTLIALLLYFNQDILREISGLFRGNVLFALKLILAVVVTAVIAIPLDSLVNGLTYQPKIVSGILFGMGLGLFAMRFHRAKPLYGIYDFTFKSAVILGLLQGIAVIPGISRSGITIIGLMLMGYNPLSSFMLSFFVGIPAIMGAAILELRHLNATGMSVPELMLGLFASFLFGLLALLTLKKAVVAEKLYWFGIYCCLIAIVVNLML